MRTRDPQQPAVLDQVDPGSDRARTGGQCLDPGQGGCINIGQALRGDQGLARCPQHPFSLHRPAVHRDDARQPGDDQQIQHCGEDGDGDPVPHRAVQRFQQQHGRGDQADRGQHQQAPPADLGTAVRDRLVDPPAGGVQRSGPVGDVEHGPASVGGPAQRPTAGQLLQAVCHVADQQRDRPQHQQLHRADPQAPAGDQAGQHRQDQHVAQRVGDRDSPGERAQAIGVVVGQDQIQPGQQTQAGGDDQCVEQARPVLGHASGPHQQQQSRRPDRVHQQVEAVSHRRERVLLVQHIGQHVERGVTGDEAQLGAGQQIPRQRPGGALQPDPRQSAQDRHQPKRRPQLKVVARQRKVGDRQPARHHDRDQPHQPGGAPRTSPHRSGRPTPRLDSLAVGDHLDLVS